MEKHRETTNKHTILYLHPSLLIKLAKGAPPISAPIIPKKLVIPIKTLMLLLFLKYNKIIFKHVIKENALPIPIIILAILIFLGGGCPSRYGISPWTLFAVSRNLSKNIHSAKTKTPRPGLS